MLSATALPSSSTAVPEELWKAVRLFSAWLDQTRGESFDPYDLWGTRYGIFSRRLYYARHPAGLPLIAPILLADVLCPGIRHLFVRKQRFATADAQLVLAFLNLHSITVDDSCLKKAVLFCEHLLNTSIPGYSGHCWGYPFDWQNNHGLWKKNTPFITATPYCFEAFLALHDTTGENRWLDIARSIAEFVRKDLHDTPTGPNAAGSSYSPIDHSLVINASAYRAMVLFEAASRFSNEDFHETATRNLNFILQSQRADGAWLYALDHPSDQFIDHFHTCFVLKNLAKLNRHLKSSAVSTAVERGYDYYRRELFDQQGLPESFAVKPRRQIVRLEMYNFAEAITLGTILREQVPPAFTESVRLATLLVQKFQLPEGYFTTRVHLTGLRHTMPFIRWPQSQLFYALTSLIEAQRNGNAS